MRAVGREREGEEGARICVCICTYKRPLRLKRLLIEVMNQETAGMFSFSIVVVDNDSEMSAKDVVAEIIDQGNIQIKYCLEARQNIPLARNKAIENARGEFVAFIDDDEMPVKEWLLNLYKTCQEYTADGVLGPIRASFIGVPPAWIVKSKVFEWPSYPTGTTLHWDQTRMGNTLLRKKLFDRKENRFRAEFRHGEDKDLFRRMTAQGHRFIWCNDAPVYELEAPERWRITYHLLRALVRGGVSLKHHSFSRRMILKSGVAFGIYTLSLPLLLVLGKHLFIRYLIKDCDHMGRLMKAVGLDPERILLG
jgi:succinoglycan biosynthesis protein ExoM